MKNYGLLFLLLSFLVFYGCASHVVTEATQLPVYRESQSAKYILITEEAWVSSTAGYPRVITNGSKWEYVGLITQGNAYKPIDHIFTIEGYHVHEAYLVVDDKKLIGFYLPAEKTFSGVRKEILLKYKIIDGQRR